MDMSVDSALPHNRNASDADRTDGYPKGPRNVTSAERQDSSDDDQSSVSRTGYSCNMETHRSGDCEYKKNKTKVEGRDIFAWKRNCFCDSTHNLATGGGNDVNLDLHLSGECGWKPKSSKTGADAGQVWQLKRKCVCSGPKSASYTGNMNWPN